MMRKPKVVILGTGGTIAGRAGSNTEIQAIRLVK